MGRIIGIDLGTTTSEISYIKNGKPEIIINREGDRITNSVVNTKNGDIIVGKKAKQNAVIDPANSILEVKRLMGTDKKVNIGGKEYTPEEISAIILKDLKKSAEEFLGEEVDEAVITVPANFNDLERNATKRAGELAGFKVERIINEPTAAALAYGINNMDKDAKILVYDLGGGTFDVTVLDFFAGIIDVKASRGNNELGGKDFDQRLIDYIVNHIKDEFGINVRQNTKILSRIKDAAESAKKELSSVMTTNINLPYLSMTSDGEPINLDLDITRATFEGLIEDLIKGTKDVVFEALDASKYEVDEIDTVLMIGGSTRVAAVKDTMRALFGDKVRFDINPDEAVAMGAAVQGGIKNNEISAIDGIIVTDTCSFTMGIETVSTDDRGNRVDGLFSPIIRRDTKVPCIERDRYSTACDNQTGVSIKVYQGEGAYATDNTFIGEFYLDGIPPRRRGEEGIEVEFTYNLNGILEVNASVLSNGRSIKGEIDTSRVVGYNKRESQEWKDLPLSDLVEEAIALIERRRHKIKPSNMNRVNRLLENLKDAVIANNKELAKSIDEDLTDLLFDI